MDVKKQLDEMAQRLYHMDGLNAMFAAMREEQEITSCENMPERFLLTEAELFFSLL